MQDALNQPLLVSKSITENEYEKLCKTRKNHEFVLFGDNTLECFTLLNPLVNPDTHLHFIAIVRLPLDQPIYVFELPNSDFVSVKVAGSYTNWALPEPVAQIVYRYDLPDFVLFSVENQKVVFAGELTETASVGNSQWQRELRKISAAELGVPFIYQTVYSGKDDSQNTIREPTSLLVYNAMLYSIRYKVPSLVLFIEPNIDGSMTRKRNSPLDTSCVSNLLASYLIQSAIGDEKLRLKIESSIFEKMIEFLVEPKYKSNGNLGEEPRVNVDYPCAPTSIFDALIQQPKEFVDELSEFINSDRNVTSSFVKKFPLGEERMDRFKVWTDKRQVEYLVDLFDFIDKKELPKLLAPLSKFSVGVIQSRVLAQYLESKCHGELSELLENISPYEETLIVPVLLHKKNYGRFQYCKDPYAGNIAAFCELLGFDTSGQKKRGIVTYCVSENPTDFELHEKYATNLYRSIAKYSDAIVLAGNEVISKFKPYAQVFEPNSIEKLISMQPINTTEDSGLTSTYVQLTNLVGGWNVCMIAIHHSSWQQIRLRNEQKILKTAKIGRNDAKVDLVLQDDSNSFLAAEGKRTYGDFFRSAQEKEKISQAFLNIYALIDKLFGTSNNQIITSFICLLDVPKVNSSFFLGKERQKIHESIKLGHISEITDQEFVLIGVYVLDRQTRFELFFSSDFDNDVKQRLIKAFV